jgi:hypothetical protein
MKTQTRHWILFLILGQMVLLLSLINNPGFADGVRDIILWFGLLPTLVWAVLIYPLKRLRIPSLNVHVGLGLLICLTGINTVMGLRGQFHHKSSKSAPPVLVFCPDGADWGIIDTLIAQGQLPNMSQALAAGCRGDLYGAEPLFSPILWTTMASGRPADQNGFAGHISDLDATLLRCRRVWDIAEEQGLSCGAVQYLGLWPLAKAPSAFAIPSFFEAGLETRPEGYGFIGRFMQDFKEKHISPRSFIRFGWGCWRRGMRLSTATYAVESILKDILAPREFRRKLLAYHFWIFLERLHVDLFCRLYQMKVPDLALYYFPTLDSVEHLYYRAFRPRGFREVSPEEIHWLGGVIPAVYDEADRALERLTDCLGENGRILMLSDHGMRTTTDMAVSGYSRVYNGLKPFPEWLGYHIEQVDWIQGFDHIYLIPKPGSGLKYGEIIAKAREAVLEEGRTPLWKVGFRDGQGKYWPEVPLDSIPGWVEITFRVSDDLPDSTRIMLPIGTRRLEDLTAFPDQILVQGAHYPKGVFLTWGKDIQRGQKLGTMSQLDILPTLLELLGLPQAQDLSGKPAAVMETSALSTKVIDSYEHPPWKPILMPQEREQRAVREALREQMKTRGYIN